MMRTRNATPGEQRLTWEQIEALLPYGTELSLEAGDRLFDETSVVNSFYVVLEGEVRISRLEGAQETYIDTHHPREFTGGLAVMTGRRSVHRGRATVPSRVLEIDSETFRSVAVEQPDVADVFISGLSRRMRETQRAFRQHEKLAALGKLSAGLAHELNNPAAAARRASEVLGELALRAQLGSLQHDERFSPKQRELLAELLAEASVSGYGELDTLETSDREEDLAVWLDDRGVDEAWGHAPSLVAAGLEPDRVETLARSFGDERALAGALGWLAATLELAGLAAEVGRSAARISELVQAIKVHTYMDRGSHAPTDVREGLESALTILGHKLGSVAVTRDYEEGLPNVWASPGDLNQVWTNLLDNAAEAVEGEGRVCVRAYHRDGSVTVEISDDGLGIPPEVQPRIFEPFFTTRQVGDGAGLGLDVVRRVVSGHGGEITFESVPGETRFFVSLPVASEGREEA